MQSQTEFNSVSLGKKREIYAAMIINVTNIMHPVPLQS